MPARGCQTGCTAGAARAALLQNDAEITHVLGDGGAHLHGSHSTVNDAHMLAGELTSAISV